MSIKHSIETNGCVLDIIIEEGILLGASRTISYSLQITPPYIYGFTGGEIPTSGIADLEFVINNRYIYGVNFHGENFIDIPSNNKTIEIASGEFQINYDTLGKCSLDFYVDSLRVYIDYNRNGVTDFYTYAFNDEGINIDISDIAPAQSVYIDVNNSKIYARGFVETTDNNIYISPDGVLYASEYIEEPPFRIIDGKVYGKSFNIGTP